jgi:hypothetical protein
MQVLQTKSSKEMGQDPYVDDSNGHDTPVASKAVGLQYGLAKSVSLELPLKLPLLSTVPVAQISRHALTIGHYIGNSHTCQDRNEGGGVPVRFRAHS